MHRRSSASTETKSCGVYVRSSRCCVAHLCEHVIYSVWLAGDAQHDHSRPWSRCWCGPTAQGAECRQELCKVQQVDKGSRQGIGLKTYPAGDSKQVIHVCRDTVALQHVAMRTSWRQHVAMHAGSTADLTQGTECMEICARCHCHSCCW
jgi:hypothetical protein